MARDERELEKVTMRLYKGQREKLQDMFPAVGYNGVIRKLIDKFLRNVDETYSRQASVRELEEQDISTILKDL